MEEIRYIEIVAQYQDMVYRIALHDCRNSHDAEDIMQTVFMKLYQKNPEFDSQEHLKHWLVHVTVNEWLFVRRKRKRNKDRLGQRDMKE